jgi:hypothetical protein
MNFADGANEATIGRANKATVTFMMVMIFDMLFDDMQVYDPTISRSHYASVLFS